jgi:tetratricopeptide (TPR) repeat protein
MPSGHRFLITAHRKLGNIYTDTANYGQGLAHLESALTIEQHQANVDPLSLAATFNGIGCVLSGQGRKDEALSYFERVLQLIPENHPQRIGALQRLGSILGQMGKIAAAHDTLRQAITLHEQQKDNSNELELARIYHSIGTIQCQSGELDNAVEIYNKALAIRKRLLPPAHSDIARLYNELGAIHLDKRDYVHALDYFQQARVIELETLHEGHLESARTQHKIGYTLFEMGRIAEAQIEEEKALAILLEKKQLYANHPLFNSIHRTLSVIRITIAAAHQAPAIIQHEQNEQEQNR